MKKYAFKTAEGQLCVLRDIDGNIDPQEFIAREFPGATIMNEIDDAVNPLPSSGYFRNAWDDDGSGNVEVNLDKAREQKKAEIAVECDERCKPERAKVIDAISTGDTDAETAAKTQISTIIAAAQAGMTTVDSETDLQAMEDLDAFDGV